jgi:hypothetical protein
VTLTEDVKQSTSDLADLDLFECDGCHIIFDIDSSHKPYGKKGIMVCDTCNAQIEKAGVFNDAT